MPTRSTEAVTSRDVIRDHYDDEMIKYTLLDDSAHIFASKYKLYLPSEEELRWELSDERDRLEVESDRLEVERKL